MHDIGGLIWVVIVLIGAISSIVKNARKARAKVVAARPKPATMRPPAPVPAPQPAFVPPAAIAALFEMPPVEAPEPLAALPAVPPLSAAPVRPVGTPLIRGMFQGPATLVRAIVAAEVLGPPKSLQEQSIWSPRHSEPSI